MIKKMVMGRDCSWLTTDIKSKMKEPDFLLKKAKRNPKTNPLSGKIDQPSIP